MKRDEAVRLVSRALAVVQFVAALEEITYLPQRMLAVQHYGRIDPRLGMTFLGLLDRVEISALLFRIAGLLALACFFWTCGSRVARLLLPEEEKEVPDPLDQPGAETPATPQ